MGTSLDVTHLRWPIKVKLYARLHHQIGHILNVNMSATRYRRFLKLCEEWPRDDYKKGRDLGTFLRQRVALAFREGENTQVSQCSEALATSASSVLTSSLLESPSICFQEIAVQISRLNVSVDILLMICSRRIP